MSNGSWEAYADAANRGEDAMLSGVPQLLRLRPEDVEASAKTVLKDLMLPPALLRREPMLLTMPSDRIVGGFDAVVKEKRYQYADTNSERREGDADAVLAAREACKDERGLLLNAATA